MMAIYLALVCGRRTGPTDSTLFVFNASMLMLLCAFMACSMLKWRRQRSVKRFAVALASLALIALAAFHPGTSLHGYYRGEMNQETTAHLIRQLTDGHRPRTVDSTQEVTEAEDEPSHEQAEELKRLQTSQSLAGLGIEPVADSMGMAEDDEAPLALQIPPH